MFTVHDKHNAGSAHFWKLLQSFLLSINRCFFAAAVIGTRLHIPVALMCVMTGIYLLFLK